MRIKIHEIYCSSVIVVESRLERCYYDYVSGAEQLEFAQIAETICDVEDECRLNNVEIYLDEAIQVCEATAAKTSRQLMIIVNGLCPKAKANFQNDILEFAAKLTERIAANKHWQARIETGGNCIIITPDR